MRKKRREEAWRLSRELHGDTVTFFLPGMFLLDGRRGRYPAVSITGGTCDFACEHCNKVILKTMIPCTRPESLLETAHRLKARGNSGMLVSGGCDPSGHLPWEQFAHTVRTIKEETGLIISVHAGFPDQRQATLLKEAGVDQVLVDVIGDDRTLAEVYHAPFGTDQMRKILGILRDTGLSLVPHVVCGLHFGKIRGEMRALEMIAEIDPEQLVIVSLMPLPGTAMRRVIPPTAEMVAEIITEGRMLMPRVPTSLGCARARGSRTMEHLALDAGVNRMALPSAETIEYARSRGLTVRYQKTCCSVRTDLSSGSWDTPPVTEPVLHQRTPHC